MRPLVYVPAIGAAFWSQWISQALYVLIALVWLVPDRRIETGADPKGTAELKSWSSVTILGM